MRLQDKIAIVTGANAEFGSVISQAFAAEGADVVCADWKQEDADIAAERVRSAGRKALALGVDLREKEEVEAMVRRTVEAYGRLDILVNATARPHHQEFLNFKEEDFDDTLARGVKPYFLTGQAAANEMVKRRYGKIVNLTSIVAKLGPGQAVDWAADRGAVDGLTRSMAHALGFWGITVNGVARGQHPTSALFRRGAGAAAPPPPGAHGAPGGHGRAHGVPGLRRRRLHHRHGALRGRRLYRGRGDRRPLPSGVGEGRRAGMGPEHGLTGRPRNSVCGAGRPPQCWLGTRVALTSDRSRTVSMRSSSVLSGSFA